MVVCASPPLECTRADKAEQVRDRVGATKSVESEVGAKWWESEKKADAMRFRFRRKGWKSLRRTVTAEFPGLGGRGEGDGCEGRLSAPGAGWAREGKAPSR